ncbi:hypothetical protein VTK56DRAFT_1059 [Thermocarpiscus australiensis]
MSLASKKGDLAMLIVLLLFTLAVCVSTVENGLGFQVQLTTAMSAARQYSGWLILAVLYLQNSLAPIPIALSLGAPNTSPPSPRAILQLNPNPEVADLRDSIGIYGGWSSFELTRIKVSFGYSITLCLESCSWFGCDSASLSSNSQVVMVSLVLPALPT